MQKTNSLSFEKVDLYVFEKSYHRKYFSNFSSSFGYFLVGKNFQIYTTDARYQKAGKDHFENSTTTLEINQNLSAVLQKNSQLFKSENITKIGFEGEITVDTFESIKNAFETIGKFEFCNISSEISAIRQIKTQEEIEKIAHAMQVSADAYNAFLKTVKVGQTERELCANLNHQLFLHGADTLAFETIIASGKNGAKPHATPSERKIQNGDLVTCDFGACIDGYNADITRTFGVGNLNKHQKEIYNIVKLVQETCLEMAVVGVKTADIHNKAVQLFESFAVGEFFTHGLGHGVGVEIHESPTLNGRSQEVLAENNVVTIEPGIYMENKFGLRIEDTIVIKSGGNCNLNPLSKELIIIN
ncbi:MAG: Xaa-Pro peptidase family protein [Bacillota bacterium]